MQTKLKKIFPLIIFSVTLVSAHAQQATLKFAPAQTTVVFTLGDVLHTVHGTFTLKSGRIRFSPESGAISGVIVVDAASGDSGSAARDRRMHRDILESARYPEFSFRPDHVDGTVSLPGPSTVQVHGAFGIQGANHEITIPVRVELAPDHWNLTAHFDIPYVRWGLKDPSTFILRVEKVVEINIQASGPSPWGILP